MEFETLDTYIKLAKKTISKFGPSFYNGLSKEMLQNPDAVSDVATAIMEADWNYDPERAGKTGQKKTLYSYRNQCALWAIKTYVTNKYKKRKNMSLDFDNSEHNHSSSNTSFSSSIIDHKNPSPMIIAMENEHRNNLSNDINNLLNSGILSQKQREQIKMYYFDDETYEAIGKKYNITREAVRQNINRALDKIKSLIKT
jgi:RNA polymerase sigma factor (sigma-70 family)